MVLSNHYERVIQSPKVENRCFTNWGLRYNLCLDQHWSSVLDLSLNSTHPLLCSTQVLPVSESLNMAVSNTQVLTLGELIRSHGKQMLNRSMVRITLDLEGLLQKKSGSPQSRKEDILLDKIIKNMWQFSLEMEETGSRVKGGGP